jgi:hypothetical protein
MMVKELMLANRVSRSPTLHASMKSMGTTSLLLQASKEAGG